jgi:acetolactate synthase-1/2/3 large subunit
METTVAQYLANTLAAHRVKRFFTMPGSTCISMNDALNNEGVLPVLCRSEESATHAAHGYAAMEESFGCAVVSRGPAATNTITGLVTACEGYPILVIIGDNASNTRQRNVATQDLPLEKIFDGVCYRETITVSARAEKQIQTVLRILINEKKSCVLIVPSDIWSKTMFVKNGEIPRASIKNTQVATSFRTALRQLPKTDKNVLLIGCGILNNPVLRKIAGDALNKYNTPYVVSTRGLGFALPQRTGWMGILSEAETNTRIYESEQIVILDESLDTATTGAVAYLQEGRKITNISVTGNGQHSITPDYDIQVQPEAFAAFFDVLLKQMIFMGKKALETSFKPKAEIILDFIIRQLPSTYTVCLDSGQNFFWGAHALMNVNKHRIIYSYTQATMGFGLPALVGITSVNPSGSLLICGDGGFLMSSEELSTIYTAGFKGKIIILNNNMLGMIYQTQKIKKLSKLAVDLKVHDLKKLVEGYGWEYISIDDIDENAIKQFLDSEKNCVLNIQLDQEEGVYPRGGTSEKLPTL